MLRSRVKSLLEKSRESAMLAVNVYNNPGAVFRSGGFIVLMNIAWTSLFHAIFENRKISYYYRDPQDKRRYLRIDGEFKAWELSKCIKEYFIDTNDPKYQNILFFVGLRNKIEHRFMPSLDTIIFGECQAYLMNFEEILTKEFGEDYALADTLLFALQYSRLRTEEQLNALRSMQTKNFRILKAYIDDFRKNLHSEVLSNPQFSFRVFLIPKPANHQSSADAAIEFIQYDPSNAEEMKKYEHIVTLIKEKNVINKFSIVNEPVNERVLLIDRGKTNSNESIGITRDASKASGILVVEKLSEEIFNDINGIVEASSIMYKRFKEFPLSDLAFHFVYSGRESIMDEDKLELLLKNGYQTYMPYYHWLLRISKDKIRRFLERAFKNTRNPRFNSIIRLLVATENESWSDFLTSFSAKFDNTSQKPAWYWHFDKIRNTMSSYPIINRAIQLYPNSKLFSYPVKDLANNYDLANNLLTEMCIKYSESVCFDRSSLRALDTIVHYNVLKDIIPNIDRTWSNKYLDAFED